MTEKEKRISLHITQKLEACAKKNLRKIIITLFVMNLAETFFLLICTSWRARLNNTVATFSVIAATIAFLFVLMILFYGLNAMLLRMERNDFVTFGFLFLGFKKFRAIAKYALIFTLLILLVCAVSVGLLTVISSALPAATKFGVMTFGWIFALVLLVLIALSLMPWCFTYCILAHEPEKQRAVLSRSRKLLHRRTRLFFSLFFKNLGFRLLRLFAIWFAMILFTVISLKAQSAPISLISSIFSFLYIYQLYVTQAFLFLLIPIIYDAFLNDSVENQVDFVDIKCLTSGEHS